MAVTNGVVDREGGRFLRATDRVRMGYLYLHDGWIVGREADRVEKTE